jgi:hypothetical protein
MTRIIEIYGIKGHTPWVCKSQPPLLRLDVTATFICLLLLQYLLAMTCGVEQFLEALGLGHYYEMFVAKGFDLEDDLCNMTAQDLEHALYITDGNHRQQILNAGTMLNIYIYSSMHVLKYAYCYSHAHMAHVHIFTAKIYFLFRT